MTRTNEGRRSLRERLCNQSFSGRDSRKFAAIRVEKPLDGYANGKECTIDSHKVSHDRSYVFLRTATCQVPTRMRTAPMT
jgi:hypothetical protein